MATVRNRSGQATHSSRRAYGAVLIALAALGVGTSGAAAQGAGAAVGTSIHRPDEALAVQNR